MSKDTKKSDFLIPHIPLELINEISAHRCALFVGAGLSVDAGFPLLEKLISQMIDYCKNNNINIEREEKSINYWIKEKNYDLVAEYLREQMDEYRFLSFMKKIFDTEITKVPKIHKLLKDIPFSQIITTNYDKILEKIFPDKKINTILNIRDINEMARRDEFFIFKIHGTIENIDTIVLGKSDYSEIIYNNPIFIDTLNLLLKTRTFLFVGYSLNDPYLKTLLEKLKTKLKLGPVHYILLNEDELFNLKIEFLKKYLNIIAIPYNTIDNHIVLYYFFNQLSQEVNKRMKEIKILPRTMESKPAEIRAPYKFLDYFRIEDRGIYYGRDLEINKFIQKIENNRLSLLFGNSGVGKTSFLLAGIFPKLYSHNYLPIYVRCTDDPIEAIKESIIFWIEKEFNDSINKEEYKNYLSKIKNSQLSQMIIETNKLIKTPLIIAIDQFEEFFITLSLQTRKNFIHEIKKLFYEFSINIKIILSFREDFFVEFHEIGNEIPNIFDHRFRLKELSKENARDAIIKPLKMCRLSMEEELLKIIINDLSIENIVEPPQLQIVCHTLYNRLDENQKKIKIDDYIDLGGVKGILMNYVDYALEPFSYHYRELAKEIMKSMVSAKRTRITLKKTEIESIKYKGKSVNNKEIEYIIKELINRRLIKRKKKLAFETYELTHEYLINKIQEWIDAESFKLKEAQDLLRQEENNWKIHKGIMERYKFEFIIKFKKKLILDNIKKALLLRTSIEYNMDIDYWTERNIENSYSITFLEHALNNGDLDVRRNACIVMLQFGIEEDVRNKIINILKEIGNPNVISKLFKIYKASNRIEEDTIKKIKEAVEFRYTRNMVFVEEGKFIMGRDKREIEEIISKGAHKKWFVGEYPKKEKFVESFLIDKYLVTNEEYKEFNPNHTFPKGHERRPVTEINWHKAKEYAEWLDKNLPTEEEWEKAARGSDERLFPWGNKWDPRRCNTRLSGISGKTNVDKYPNGVSPYGCYDMAGNVWEWTNSWKEKNKIIVLKGGSWAKYDILPWCSYRFDSEPNEGLPNLGFRCIRRIKNNLEQSNKVYSAGGLIFRHDDNKINVLLCGAHDPVKWRIPKGMLNKDESVKRCAVREVLEETGYLGKIIRFIDFTTWSYWYEDKIWDETVFFFILQLKDEEQKSHDTEFEYVKWFTIDKAIEILYYNKEREVAKKALELFQSLFKNSRGK